MADNKDSATAVVKSEQPDNDFPFENDGNFLQNYLNSRKTDKKEPDGGGHIKKEMPPKKVLPTLKKSRFTSMLSQMKRAKSGGSTSSSFKKSTLNDSSSDDESKTGIKFCKTTANISSAANFKNAEGQPMAKVKMEPKSEGAMPQSRPRKRKSRWGEKVDIAEVAPPGLASIPGVSVPAIQTNILGLGVSNAYRTPGLVGCSELSDAQRKQLEEQREMQAMYNMIMASRNAQQAAAEATRQTSQKKNRHAYDSDEEIDDKLGTWEHQKRRVEMEKTKELAEKLTNESDSKHFIGDFLPPDQLERFMETFKSLKEGRTPDFSDYKDFKLKCDNIGFKMLEKMGWNEGEGLGSVKQGITAPINQGKKSIDGRGVGVNNPDVLHKDDDEFSAYRKRMMLAYRFRPNPLNNPRRPYY